MTYHQLINVDNLHKGKSGQLNNLGEWIFNLYFEPNVLYSLLLNSLLSDN